ncbi:MAG: ClbS/DfsB family four-helix bundle protein [Chloroflexota bacterium]|nr:ClbS/DfsB family four-helix bundle protein [Chloroflexota bacterium]
MSAPQTMAEIITRIEQAMQRVVQAVTPLSPAYMQEPRLSNGQSVKDVLAHLTWWDQWLLFSLPSDQNTPSTPITPPLVDQIPPTDHWADEMNAKVYAYNQLRELSSIQAEFTATCTHLLQRVSQLSINDLYNPDGIAAIIGQPVAPLILGIYEHYEEHAHELEQLNA